MLNSSQRDHNPVGVADSRAHARLQVHSLAYIELSDENAGLILNISETGIAVQAVQVLTSEHFPRMRFRLPKTENLIEAAGRMVWQIRSKKEAGIEFAGLTEKTKAQIRDWIAAQRARDASPRTDNPRQAVSTPIDHARQGAPVDVPPRRQEHKPGEAGPRFHSEASKSEPSVSRPAVSRPGARESRDSETPAQGFNDWISRHRPAVAGDGGNGGRGDSTDETGRESRFHLPPLRMGMRGGGEPEDAAGPDRIPAMPQWNGYMAPGVGMEFKKPRRWWTYTAALGFIAALGFAAIMMFNPDTVTRARMEALTRLHSSPANNGQSTDQNNGASDQLQQNAPGNPDTAQNSQTPPADTPVPPAAGTNSNPAAEPPAGITPTPASPDGTSAAPDAGSKAANNPAGSGANRPVQTSPGATVTNGGGRTGASQSSPTRTSNYGRSANSSAANRNQSAYQNPSRYGSSAYNSQNRAQNSAPSSANTVAPYRSNQSTPSQREATPYQPNTQSSTTYSRNGNANPPAASGQTSGQTRNGNEQQAAAQGNSVASSTTANQNTRPAQSNVDAGKTATQGSAAAPAANQGPLEAWRAQTESASKPAGNPATSQTNQQPAPTTQQPAAQRDQDAYARRSTAAPSNGSNAAAAQTAQSKSSSVEMSGPSSPVPPSVPLSGVPSGSVGATSQFHGFVVPPDLQSRSNQLGGQLQIGQLLSSYSPVYPVEAAREGIEGTVRLDVTVGRDGSVRNVRVISGPAMLTSAAAEAVQGWRYGETFLAGQPIEARQYVTVVFRLAEKSSR